MTKAEASPYRIIWRPAAEADLDKIIDYIAQDNARSAEEFGRELLQKTQWLELHPQMGRAGRPGLPDFVRELVVHRNYIVFYRVRIKARVVEILRVKHTALRLP